jgi:hypothetical protein
MYGLGEPFAGQVVSNARFAGFLQNYRSHCGKLKAQAHVVHEARDLLGACAPWRLPGNHVWQIAEFLPSGARLVPPSLKVFFDYVWRARHNIVDLFGLVFGMNDYSICPPDDSCVDLLSLYATHVHAGPEPLGAYHWQHR